MRFFKLVCLHCSVAMVYQPKNLFDQPKPLWLINFYSNEDVKVFH